VTRREPFLTIDGLRMSKHRMFFSSAKAERDLGYKARTLSRSAQGGFGVVSRQWAIAMRLDLPLDHIKIENALRILNLYRIET